jgi:glycosyltransferase involved in cell wall biosynthesis
MKILYVLHKDPDISLGGVERHTVDLARILHYHGWNIHLMFPSSSHLVIAEITKKGFVKRKIEGEFCDDLLIRNDSLDKRFGEVLRELSVDIVHFQHFLGFPLSLIKEANHHAKKIFITMHDYFFWCPNYKLISPLNGAMQFCKFEEDEAKCLHCLEIIYKKKIRYHFVKERRTYANDMLSKADRIFFPSQYLSDVFSSLFWYPKEKNIVTEHGITLHGDLSRPQANGKLNIAHLGAFTYEKGARQFLDIVRKTADKKASKKIQFHIIGELGLPIPDEFHRYDNVKIYGSYRPENVHSILRRNHIDLILLLSLWPETYSYTLSEAIVNNIPVISSDLGAMRERIPQYSAGYLVPYEKPGPRSLEIICDYMEYPEIQKYFKKKCSQAAKRLPSLFDMAQRYMKAYQG